MELFGELGAFYNTPLVDANGLPSMLRYAKAPGKYHQRYHRLLFNECISRITVDALEQSDRKALD